MVSALRMSLKTKKEQIWRLGDLEIWLCFAIFEVSCIEQIEKAPRCSNATGDRQVQRLARGETKMKKLIFGVTLFALLTAGCDMRGRDGATGPAGAEGKSGATGTGATGASGSTGADGASGVQGADGKSGATGAAGADGATGAAGADGAKGAQGKPGDR